MSKVTLGMLLLSLALVVAFFAHGLATGIVLPYPDPTPAQAAHERFHQLISSALFLGAGGSLAACVLSCLIWGWLTLKRRRHRA